MSRAGERGSVSLLSLGLMLVAVMLVVVAVDVTAVQLARTQLWDAADAAALDAVDRLDEEQVYAGGLGELLPLSTAGVHEAAATHLAADRRPPLVTDWSLGGSTGSPDGRTAVVELRGHVRLPLTGPVVDRFGGGVDLVVRSRARSRVG